MLTVHRDGPNLVIAFGSTHEQGCTGVAVATWEVAVDPQAARTFAEILLARAEAHIDYLANRRHLHALEDDPDAA